MPTKKTGSFPAFEPPIPSNWSGQQQQQLRFAYISWQIKVKRVILRVVVQHSPGKPANCRIMFSIKLINAICPGALYQAESQLGCFPLSDFVLLLWAFQHRWTRQGKHSRQTEQHCYDKQRTTKRRPCRVYRRNVMRSNRVMWLWRITTGSARSQISLTPWHSCRSAHECAPWWPARRKDCRPPVGPRGGRERRGGQRRKGRQPRTGSLIRRRISNR